MAYRNLDNLNSVTQVTPEQSNGIVQAIAGIGQKIIQQSQEAKINENLSKAQLEVNALTNQYQIDFEGDPFGGLEDYKANRQAIFDKYGGGVSSLFMRDYQNGTSKLAQSNDLGVQAWGYKQSHVNTVNSINNSIQNNLGLALNTGQKFASGQISEVEALSEFAASRQQLEEYGNKNLGSESTAQLLKNYDEDQLKVFLSGIGDTNPAMALNLLDHDVIKSGFSNPEQYLKMKHAMTSRAKKSQQIAGQQADLDSVNNDNAPLLQWGGKMNYQQLESLPLSAKAKEYYSKINGYSGASGKRGGMTPKDKAQYKLAIFNSVSSLVNRKENDPDSVAVVNDAIMDAMDKGAITQTEGASYIQNIVNPMIKSKQEAMKQFSSDTWAPFEGHDIGFNDIEEYYKKNVETKDLEGGEATGELTAAGNLTKKANLYGFYYDALEGEAKKRGIAVGDIPNLPKPDAQKIYGEAQKQAIDYFAKDEFPALRVLPDTPNFVYGNGRVLPVSEGKRDIKPDVKVTDMDVRIEVDKNKNKARVFYKGGRRMKAEILNKDGSIAREVIF